ncbi:hypothetical protein ACFYQ5_35095 [Streptomyces sp. NPDC005794]
MARTSGIADDLASPVGTVEGGLQGLLVVQVTAHGPHVTGSVLDQGAGRP